MLGKPNIVKSINELSVGNKVSGNEVDESSFCFNR